MSSNDKNYKEQLEVKLRSLVVVLDSAISKIVSGQGLTGANIERLEIIKGNLINTRKIMIRALETLTGVPRESSIAASGARAFVELGSRAEFEKFKEMGPIAQSEIDSIDWVKFLDQMGRAR